MHVCEVYSLCMSSQPLNWKDCWKWWSDRCLRCIEILCRLQFIFKTSEQWYQDYSTTRFLTIHQFFYCWSKRNPLMTSSTKIPKSKT